MSKTIDTVQIHIYTFFLSLFTDQTLIFFLELCTHIKLKITLFTTKLILRNIAYLK